MTNLLSQCNALEQTIQHYKAKTKALYIDLDTAQKGRREWFDKAEAAGKERDELQSDYSQLGVDYLKLETERDGLQRVIEQDTYCAYCGHAYPRGTPKFENQLLTVHIRQCPKHPMRKLEERLEEAQSVLEEARKRWLSPSTSPLDVLDKLAAALTGEEGE